MPEIRVLTSALTTLGENPLWDVETERLYWIDVFGEWVFQSRADGSELTVFKSGRINALALRAGGGAIAVAGPRLLLLDLEAGESTTFYDSPVSFNDCAIDRQGRFVTGGVADGMGDPTTYADLGDAEPQAGLFRVDADLSVHQFGDGVGASNGPTFSPDGATLYWSDSTTRRVYAWDYDVETGLAANRRRHVEFQADSEPDAIGIPDGAAIDAEGYRWVAAFYGGEVRRYAPDGSLDRRLKLPVHSPTGITFGGPDLDVLYVTSLAMNGFPGNPHQSGPLDGTLLAVHGLGVQGTPELRFAG